MVSDVWADTTDTGIPHQATSARLSVARTRQGAWSSGEGVVMVVASSIVSEGQSSRKAALIKPSNVAEFPMELMRWSSTLLHLVLSKPRDVKAPNASFLIVLCVT